MATPPKKSNGISPEVSQKLIEKIKYFEDYRDKPYLDTQKKLTIGYGINLDSPENREYIKKYTPYKVEDVLSGKVSFSKDQADKYVRSKLNTLYNDVKTYHPNVDKYPAEIQSILYDMDYNMGPTKLAGFKKMNAAIQKGDYAKAAEELKNSNYFKQTGRRAKSHYETLMGMPKASTFTPLKPIPVPVKEPGYIEEFMSGWNAPYNDPKTDYNFPIRFLGGLQELFGATNYNTGQKKKDGGWVYPANTAYPSRPKLKKGDLVGRGINYYSISNRPDKYSYAEGAGPGIIGDPGLERGYGMQGVRGPLSFLNPYGQAGVGALYDAIRNPNSYFGAQVSGGISPRFERHVTDYRRVPVKSKEFTTDPSEQPETTVKKYTRQNYWSLNPNLSAGLIGSTDAGIGQSSGTIDLSNPNFSLIPYASPGVNLNYNFYRDGEPRHVGLTGKASYSPGYKPQYLAGITYGGEIPFLDAEYEIMAGVRPDMRPEELSGSLGLTPMAGITVKNFLGGKSPERKRSMSTRYTKEQGGYTFLQPTSSKLPQGYAGPVTTPSTELAMSIGGENGEPAYLIPTFKYGQLLKDPIEEFKKTGEHLGGPFKTWQEAEEFGKLRHQYVEKGQDIPTPIKPWGEEYRRGGKLTKKGKKRRKYGPRPDYMNQNPSGMTTGPITQRSIGNTPGGGYMSFGEGGNTAYESWYRYNTPEGREGIPESYSSYDYQRYYNDAVRGLNPMNFDEESQHFPDTYKYPWHPSFSDESIYYTNQKETPALSYNTKADWKEYLRSKKAKGGWTGYPDHTMYSSAMSQFDKVRDYTKYADGGNITPYNISDPEEFKKANQAYQDSLGLYKKYYDPELIKDAKKYNWDIVSVPQLEQHIKSLGQKYSKKSFNKIRPLYFIDPESEIKNKKSQWIIYPQYKKPVRKPIYTPEPVTSIKRKEITQIPVDNKQELGKLDIKKSERERLGNLGEFIPYSRYGNPNIPYGYYNVGKGQRVDITDPDLVPEKKAEGGPVWEIIDDRPMAGDGMLVKPGQVPQGFFLNPEAYNYKTKPKVFVAPAPTEAERLANIGRNAAKGSVEPDYTLESIFMPTPAIGRTLKAVSKLGSKKVATSAPKTLVKESGMEELLQKLTGNKNAKLSKSPLKFNESEVIAHIPGLENPKLKYSPETFDLSLDALGDKGLIGGSTGIKGGSTDVPSFNRQLKDFIRSMTHGEYPIESNIRGPFITSTPKKLDNYNIVFNNPSNLAERGALQFRGPSLFYNNKMNDVPKMSDLYKEAVKYPGSEVREMLPIDAREFYKRYYFPNKKGGQVTRPMAKNGLFTGMPPADLGIDTGTLRNDETRVVKPFASPLLTPEEQAAIAKAERERQVDRAKKISERKAELDKYYSQPGLISGVKNFKPDTEEMATAGIDYEQAVKEDPIGTVGVELALGLLPEASPFISKLAGKGMNATKNALRGESKLIPKVDVAKNIEDLKAAQQFAQEYGYELPSNIERISQSNVLTDRVIRGMMNRHNTFVRGVSTNWKELAQRNPEILRHLEGKGFDLSTKEGTKAAAEYMATHIPINTGYGRASLDKEVFDMGMQGLYTSNSVPTAEGYTYGQGYVTKVKKPTDFSFSNRQDWINKNNPYYRDEDKFRELMYPLSNETKHAIYSSKSKMWRPKSYDEKLLKNASPKQKAIKEVEYRIEKLKNDIAEIELNKDKWLNAQEMLSPKKQAIKQMESDIKYLEQHGDEILQAPGEFKMLRTERSKLARDAYDFLLKKEGTAQNLSEFLKRQPFQQKMKEYHNLGESLTKYTWNEQAPLRERMETLKKEATEMANQSIQDYMKMYYPDYDPVNRYAHYIHLGTPGEKVLEPIKSWEITPEIWKNKSRSHSNEYTKKLSAMNKGGQVSWQIID